MKRTLRVVRRDEWFHETYQRTLRDIEERLAKLPMEERNAEAYGVLRGFFETVLESCQGTFTVGQLVEVRIILTALDIATRESDRERKGRGQ